MKLAGKRLNLYLFEWVVIVYAILMCLLLILFGRPFSEYVGEFLFYLGVSLLALVVAFTIDDQKETWQAIIRLGYLVVLFTFFYRTTGGLMSLFFDRFFDADLVQLEASLLGGHPTLYIDQHMLNTWVTELVSFCYFCYYLMIPGFFIPVLLRRDYAVIKQALAAVSLTYFISYFLFSVYPVEGPRWHFAAQYMHKIEGPIFRPMVEFVINHGAVRGGAMPSSHTGVALIILMYCFRHYRRFAWPLLPIVPRTSSL